MSNSQRDEDVLPFPSIEIKLIFNELHIMFYKVKTLWQFAARFR